MSLLLGIAWLYWVGSVLALVLGHVARAQIRHRRSLARQGSSGMTATGGVEPDGSRLALAGIVAGWLGVAGLLTFLVVGLVGPT